MTVRLKMILFSAVTLLAFLALFYVPVPGVQQFLQVISFAAFVGGVFATLLTYVWQTDQGFLINEDNPIGRAITTIARAQGSTEITSCQLGEGAIIVTGVPILWFLLLSDAGLTFMTSGWSGIPTMLGDLPTLIMALGLLALCTVSYLCLFSWWWNDNASFWFFSAVIFFFACLPATLFHYMAYLSWKRSWVYEGIALAVVLFIVFVVLDRKRRKRGLTWQEYYDQQFIAPANNEPTQPEEASSASSLDDRWYAAICPAVAVIQDGDSMSGRAKAGLWAGGAVIALLVVWGVGYTVFTSPRTEVVHNTKYERDGYDIHGSIVIQHLKDGRVIKWRTQGDRLFLYREWASEADFTADNKLNQPDAPRKSREERVPIDENDATLSTYPFGSPGDEQLQERWQALKKEIENESPFNRRWVWPGQR